MIRKRVLSRGIGRYSHPDYEQQRADAYERYKNRVNQAMAEVNFAIDSKKYTPEQIQKLWAINKEEIRQADVEYKAEIQQINENEGIYPSEQSSEDLNSQNAAEDSCEVADNAWGESEVQEVTDDYSDVADSAAEETDGQDVTDDYSDVADSAAEETDGQDVTDDYCDVADSAAEETDGQDVADEYCTVTESAQSVTSEQSSGISADAEQSASGEMSGNDMDNEM